MKINDIDTLNASINTGSHYKVIEVIDDDMATSYLMQSVLAKLREDYSSIVEFYQIDYSIASEYFNFLKLQTPPICLILTNGFIVEIFNGLVPATTIKNALEKRLYNVKH